MKKKKNVNNNLKKYVVLVKKISFSVLWFSEMRLFFFWLLGVFIRVTLVACTSESRKKWQKTIYIMSKCFFFIKLVMWRSGQFLILITIGCRFDLSYQKIYYNHFNKIKISKPIQNGVINFNVCWSSATKNKLAQIEWKLKNRRSTLGTFYIPIIPYCSIFLASRCISHISGNLRTQC